MEIIKKTFQFIMSQNKIFILISFGIILWILFFLISGIISFFSSIAFDPAAIASGIGGGLVILFILLRSILFR